MNRRTFLKSFFSGAPILAAPSIAVSMYAADKSLQAEDKLKDVIVNSEGAVIQNCQFTLGGNLQIQGDKTTIHSCDLTCNSGTAVAIDPALIQTPTFTGYRGA